MVDLPQTRYARGPAGDIAYQVIGDGPRDLIVVPGWFSHLDLQWDDPLWRAFVSGLSSFARVVLYDKRGTGLSDPVDGAPTLQSRADDLLAVIDAAETRRPALFGFSEGGPISLLFAATYPERVSSLILYGTGAAPPDSAVRGRIVEFLITLRRSVDDWGAGMTIDWAAPSLREDPSARKRIGALERAAMSPKMALLTWQAVTQLPNLKPIAESIGVPTLVLHRKGEVTPVEMGRELAAAIPGARLVELEGIDHLPYVGDMGAITGEVEEFLTGQRHEKIPERVLATVLFTDIVDSTSHAADVGDERWRDLLERHDEIARSEIASYQGRFVKHTGDGLLATFDGPTRAVLCAKALTERMPEAGLDIRSGLHTGECLRRGDDIGGIAVHIAARIAAKAGTKEVLVSNTVKDLVYGSGITFEDRGAHALKGVPGQWQLFSPVGTHDPVENLLTAAAQM
jgi:class 3 adenylate cyclase/pimeloyl-ACP methyl ester carboxylesterase